MSRLFLFVILATSHSALCGPREVASQAFPSVAMVVTEDAHGQPLAIGSGFFVKRNVLASNAHVIEGAAGGYIKLVGQKAKYELKEIVGIDAKHDLVLLAVDNVGAQFLSFGDFAKVTIGDAVYSVGSPKGLEGTFADGIVSAIREVDGDKLLQHTAPISPGSSGGPILNEEGKVVGVAVAAYKDGQNLNFAIPVTHLSSLMTQPGDPKPFAGYKQNSSNSYLKDIGESSRKGVSIDSFIWTARSLEFVLRNNLRTPVTNIKALILFRDENGEACDFKEITWPTYQEVVKVPSLADMKKGANIETVKEPVGESIIPAGLAKPSRVTVDAGTRLRAIKTAPEVRVLGFDIAKNQD